MKACRLLHPPGETISLTILPEWDEQFEEHVLAAIADVLNDLSPVVRMLDADLTLACRKRNSVFQDSSVFPIHERWYLRQDNVPPHVSFRARTFEDLQTSSAPRLTPKVVLNWLREALAQEPPSPEYVVSFGALECFHSSARLDDSDDWEQTGEFQLHDGTRTLKIPIERDASGVWVSAPAHGLSMYPAVAFEIANYDGLLNTRIQVSWSRWVERGTGEHDALQRSLQALVSRGWKPELVPRDFDLGAIAGTT